MTNHNRDGKLTNQSRRGSHFRQRLKRGAAAQAVWENKNLKNKELFFNIKAWKHVTVEAHDTRIHLKMSPNRDLLNRWMLDKNTDWTVTLIPNTHYHDIHHCLFLNIKVWFSRTVRSLNGPIVVVYSRPFDNLWP